MSLLSLTVKKARFVGAQALQWSSYATLKLQNVKSTTVVVKGASPSWEQDFLFELNNLDAGLLIEVWNKGRFWDNVIGYHYLFLSDIHCSNVAGAGQWLSLDAELVMRDGEVVGTKAPTGHVLLVDARFELPLGDVDGDEAVEMQWKLEMLNSMLDQEARAEQSRRQHQYYIQCESGVSEDSDYTSDVNYPVGQHPNSSASQYLSAASQQFSTARSLNSSRENSYEKDEDQRVKPLHPYPSSSPRSQKPRLLPNPHSQEDQGYEPTDSRNYETDPLYYNSRPQPYKPSYESSNYRGNSFEDGYNYSQQVSEEYHDAEEYPTHHPTPKRRKPLRRKVSSLERQDTFYEDGEPDLRDYSSIKDARAPGDTNHQILGYVSTNSNCDQYSSHHQSQLQQHPQIVYNNTMTQGKAFYDPPYSEQYNRNYVEEGSRKYNLHTPADYVDNTTTNVEIGSQERYQEEDWYRGDVRDHYAPPNSTIEYTQKYPEPSQQNQPHQQSKPTFQQHFGLSNIKKTIASVFPTITTQPSTMLKTEPNPTTNSQIPKLYSNTPTSEYSVPSQAKPYTDMTDQVVPEMTAPILPNQYEEERFDYENWDFTNGYYDESGNFVPYTNGYYDESGNFISTEGQVVDGYYEYESHVVTGNGNKSFDNPDFYSQGHETTGPTTVLQHQYSDEYQYEEKKGYDSYYYSQDTEFDDALEFPPVPIQSKGRQQSIQSQSSVDYNYAYQSVENLSTSSFDKHKAEKSVERANSIIRRQSFRRQTSTRDYGGSECGPSDTAEQLQTGQAQSIKSTPAATQNTHEAMDTRSMSIEDTRYDGGWTSQEYLDADESMLTNSYEHYEDAEEHPIPSEGVNGEGPVHMDSLESNTSEQGPRDRDANEKFEAQYWQRQRERIAEQATLCSQDSQEYYGYDSFEIPDEPQHPQRLESIDESPFSPPSSLIAGSVTDTTGPRRQMSETEWLNGTRSARNSLDQAEDWVSRQGSLKLKKDMMGLSRQETLEGAPNVPDEEYLREFDEDEMGHRFMRKHSIASVDSQGETLPPTSPPPSDHKSAESQLSVEEDSITERKDSLEVPGKDKGSKTVSFDEEPPKVMIPERHTKGMTSKEKWLWSMNRICSQLQVSSLY